MHQLESQSYYVDIGKPYSTNIFDVR